MIKSIYITQSSPTPIEKMRANNYKPDLVVPFWIDENGDQYHAPVYGDR